MKYWGLFISSHITAFILYIHFLGQQKYVQWISDILIYVILAVFFATIILIWNENRKNHLYSEITKSQLIKNLQEEQK